MSNISIYETDITARQTTYDPTKNIVYIPGFTCGYIKSNVASGTSTGATAEVKADESHNIVAKAAQPSTKYFELKDDNTYVGTSDITTQAGKIYYEKVDNKLYKQINEVEDVETFEKIYGVTPYKFQNNQTNPDNFTLNINSGDYDKSYIIAKELLTLGCSILYEAFPIAQTEANTVKDMYGSFFNTDKTGELDKLEDLNTYNVKLITLGGYPALGNVDSTTNPTKWNSTTLTEQLLTLACTRNEAIAILDYEKGQITTPAQLHTVVQTLPTLDIATGPAGHFEDAKSYGAMFTPNCVFNTSYVLGNRTGLEKVELPASAAYLISFAKSVQSNPNFYAIAGATRGAIPFLSDEYPVVDMSINGKQAEDLTPDDGVSVNPITRVNPYGYCIWGNRTLRNNSGELVASSFLNTRLLMCDIKKIMRNVALKLNFEIKSDILWLNFRSQVEPQLDKIIANNGIERYKLTQISTTERGKMKIKLTVWCLYAVEKWDMEVELTDSYVSVQ